MSQGFLAAEPETGVRAFGSLYSVIRTNFQALQSAHSGTAWPASPVGGQHCWRTDYSPRRLYIYNDLSSSWDEVTLATAGLGLELIAARGSHASLDARLDSQINEDGTFKASTASGLNPSQWYDLTVASGWVSTTSFKAKGADYTAVYHPTRRLKVNRDAGAYYTEVVSSSYGAPDTTVVTRDAVCGAAQANLRYVSHSIVAPRKASGGDGAVSFEMVSNRNIGTATGATFTQAVGDSMIVVTAGSACAVTLQTAAVCAGRDVIIINASSYTATVNATWAVLAGQTLWLISDGTSWRRGDIPLSLTSPVLGGTVTGTYTLGGTPTITPQTWIDVSLSSGWVNSSTVSYMKDPFGVVHLRGYAYSNIASSAILFTLPSSPNYQPYNSMRFLTNVRTSTGHCEYLMIKSNGDVEASYYGILDYVYFDGITFMAG